jgi:hypothetical protein
MKKEAQTKAISREIVIEFLDGLLRGMRGTNEKNLLGEKFYYPYYRSLGAISTCIEFLALGEGTKRLMTWQTVVRLNRRLPSLGLVRTIDTMVRRAIMRHVENLLTESSIEKALRDPDSIKSQMLLRDFVQNPSKFQAAVEENTKLRVEYELTWPVVEWGLHLGHPLAVRVSSVDTSLRLANDAYIQNRLAVKRLRNRERQKRHRQRKKTLPEKRYATPT